MNKYRVCPECGLHNAPNMIECIDCETDLTSVPVVDENSERTELMPHNPHIMIRLCDCGGKNPAAARKCSFCGEDISDITPIVDDGKEKLHFTFAAIDGSYAYEITESEVVIGREHKMKEYLSSKPYVSRIHARLTIDGGKLFITNISGTNHTYVNNIKSSGERHELHDGDEIGLGGCIIDGSRQEKAAYFLVRIGSCL